MFIDGVQVEAGEFATPYKETSAGAATRLDASLQGSASTLLTATQGWVLCRGRLEVSPIFVNPETFFSWLNAGHLIQMGWSGSDFFAQKAAGGAPIQANVPGNPTARTFTLICVWTAGGLALSVDGDPFVQVGGTAIPVGLPATFDIGKSGATPRANFKMNTLVTGIGRLTDVEAQAMHAWLVDNEDVEVVDRRNVPGECTGFYNMIAAAGV
jgi:hypothetical protein